MGFTLSPTNYKNMAIPFNGTDLSQIGTAFLPLILLETGLNF
jgi:hypothetical protein